MLENVISNVTYSHVDNTLVVLGSGKELLSAIVNKTSAKYCSNDNYTNGMLSSVKCGFRNLPPDVEAVLVFQGDQPMITPAVTNTLIEEYRKSGKGIVIPVYKRKRGHPLLIDGKYRDIIEQLDAGIGLRSLASQFPGDVLEVDIDEPGILRDFDTFEDYKKGINQML